MGYSPQGRKESDTTLARHLTIAIFFLFKLTTQIRLDGPWEWECYFTLISSSVYTVSDTLVGTEI